MEMIQAPTADLARTGGPNGRRGPGGGGPGGGGPGGGRGRNQNDNESDMRARILA